MLHQMGLSGKMDLDRACRLIAGRIGFPMPERQISVRTRIVVATAAKNLWGTAEGRKRILTHVEIQEPIPNVVRFERKPKIKQERGPSESKLKAFYKSWEWKRLRYDFLKEVERRCQCCGATPDDGVHIVVDHIKPIRHFWHLRLDINNLQALCNDCNMGKGSRDHTNWGGNSEQEKRLEAIRLQLGESE